MADTITLSDLATAIINDKNIPTHSDIATIIPTQTSNSGKFLTTNGTTLTWGNVDTLPNQAFNSGKFLTTNGSTSNWSEISILPSQTDNSGKFLTTDGTSLSWGNSGNEYQKLDMSVTDPNGYGRGIRRDVIVENCCFSNEPNAISLLFNGKRGSGGGTSGTEGNFHYKLREGGALIFTHITYGFNWNTFYMVESWETGSYDAIFKVYGSDNKADWIELASESWNNWDTWTPDSNDSGIDFNGSGNLVYRKLQWSQPVTKYYRHYMFKCHSGESRHSWQQHGFDVSMGAMYEIEWGRE